MIQEVPAKYDQFGLCGTLFVPLPYRMNKQILLRGAFSWQKKQDFQCIRFWHQYVLFKAIDLSGNQQVGWIHDLGSMFGLLVSPLKTNMSPENQWLEDVFPTKIVPFLGTC